jgi:hypothetical protein
MFIFTIDQDLWVHKLMSRIISCDHSLSRKDVLKFILFYYDPILVQ